MPKVTWQRNGRMRNDKISAFCSITHPRFLEHSSTPENTTSTLYLLMESKEVPLEKSKCAWIQRQAPPQLFGIRDIWHQGMSNSFPLFLRSFLDLKFLRCFRSQLQSSQSWACGAWQNPQQQMPDQLQICISKNKLCSIIRHSLEGDLISPHFPDGEKEVQRG